MIGERSVLCMDWDERSLRVLDVRLSRGRMRISKAVRADVPEHVNVHDPASLSAFLKRTLGEHRLRARRAIVDVPRQDVVLNQLSLPRGSADEMAAMVHVQAAKELPFTKEQAVIDYAISGEQKGGLCEVWMAAVRTAVLDRYRQVIASAGLKLERVGLRPYANVASLDVALLGERRTLMVDIGPAMTEICVIANGRLAFSRAASVTVPPAGLLADGGAPRPGSRPQPAPGDEGIPFLEEPVGQPDTMERLLIEVSRTVEAYRAMTPGAAIEQIVLAGATGAHAGVAERFAQRFGIPCRIYRRPASLKWPGAEGSEAAFSVVIGLAIGTTTEGLHYFDFLNPKEPEAAQRERQRRRPILAATIALFVLAAGVVAYQPIARRKARIAALEEQKQFLNRDRDARQMMLDQFKDYEAWQKTNVVWIDQLMRLGEAFPPNSRAYITKVEFDHRGRITIDLVAKDETVATTIVDQLTQMTDKSGQPVFTARTGRASESADEDYPVRDQVHVEMVALRTTS